MLRKRFLVTIAGLALSALVIVVDLSAQAIGYQKRYDDPYDISKIFAHFQPLYGEAAASNMSIGLGFEIDYLHDHLFDASLHVRRSYGQRTDLMRDAAENNSSLSDAPKSYTWVELGGTYHYKDFEEEVKSKVFLYARKYKGTAWSSRVITTTEVDSKVRKIYGGRAGGYFYNTSFDLNRAMEKQGVQILDANNNAIDSTTSLFGNLKSVGFYLGASMSWYKNFSVDFEREYDPGGDDLLLTTYFDILVGPGTTIDDLTYAGTMYSAQTVDVTKFGFRLGVEGKYNRVLGWSYGAELGYRPSVKNQGFFVMLKVGFPVYSTDLKYSKIESVEQE